MTSLKEQLLWVQDHSVNASSKPQVKPPLNIHTQLPFPDGFCHTHCGTGDSPVTQELFVPPCKGALVAPTDNSARYRLHKYEHLQREKHPMLLLRFLLMPNIKGSNSVQRTAPQEESLVFSESESLWCCSYIPLLVAFTTKSGYQIWHPTLTLCSWNRNF